jgi:hypothetical protein
MTLAYSPRTRNPAHCDLGLQRDDEEARKRFRQYLADHAKMVPVLPKCEQFLSMK